MLVRTSVSMQVRPSGHLTQLFSVLFVGKVPGVGGSQAAGGAADPLRQGHVVLF